MSCLTTEIQAVAKVLRRHTDNFIIAGGYARDHYYGRKLPRDADVWVSQPSTALTAELGQLADTSYVHAYEDTQDILAVFKIGNVDVICLKDNNPVKHVMRFDFNINQFIIKNAVITYVGPGHPPRNRKEVFQYDHAVVTPKRHDRMEEVIKATFPE